MTDRPPDRQSSRPPARRRGPGPGFFTGLYAILRLGLLAITFAGTLNALVNVFRSATVARTVGAPAGLTYLALTMAAASTVLMVASTVNAAFLIGRLFSRRVASYVVAAVFVLGAASVAVGFLGSTKLGAVAAVSLLIPAVAFVLNMLLVNFAGPAPGAKSSPEPPAASRRPAPGASQRPGRAPQSRRRGGRKR